MTLALILAAVAANVAVSVALARMEYRAFRAEHRSHCASLDAARYLAALWPLILVSRAFDYVITR